MKPLISLRRNGNGVAKAKAAAIQSVKAMCNNDDGNIKEKKRIGVINGGNIDSVT